MNWERVTARLAAHFGPERTALAAAISEVQLAQTRTYLDAVLAEMGSPADREEALIDWGKRRGEIWRR